MQSPATWFHKKGIAYILIVGVVILKRKFENIYVGWGHKFDADNYTPLPPPAAMEEYPVVPEVTEVDDPTVDEERELKKAQEEAMEAAEDMDDVDDDEDDDD